MSNYYIDEITGLDSNAGTIESPWKTLRKAFGVSTGIHTVYLRKGNYFLATGADIVCPGTLITVSAYQNELVYVTNQDGVKVTISSGIELDMVNIRFINIDLAISRIYSGGIFKLRNCSFFNCAASIFLNESGAVVSVKYCSTSAANFTTFFSGAAPTESNNANGTESNTVLVCAAPKPAVYDDMKGNILTITAGGALDLNFERAAGPYVAKSDTFYDDVSYAAGRAFIGGETIAILSGPSARVLSEVFCLGDACALKGFGFVTNLPSGTSVLIEYRFSPSVFLKGDGTPAWATYTRETELPTDIAGWVQLRITLTGS